MLDLKAIDDANEDEFLRFERVKDKLSQRPDLHAFLLLDRLLPGTSDIVASAEHDEIWLDADPEKLAEIVTKDQWIELMRCGVRYDDDIESLAMFV